LTRGQKGSKTSGIKSDLGVNWTRIEEKKRARERREEREIVE
jgi:hypothetical protein